MGDDISSLRQFRTPFGFFSLFVTRKYFAFVVFHSILRGSSWQCIQQIDRVLDWNNLANSSYAEAHRTNISTYCFGLNLAWHEAQIAANALCNFMNWLFRSDQPLICIRISEKMLRKKKLFGPFMNDVNPSHSFFEASNWACRFGLTLFDGTKQLFILVSGTSWCLRLVWYDPAKHRYEYV